MKTDNGYPNCSWWIVPAPEFASRRRQEQDRMQRSYFGRAKVLSSASYTVDYAIGSKPQGVEDGYREGAA